MHLNEYMGLCKYKGESSNVGSIPYSRRFQSRLTKDITLAH